MNCFLFVWVIKITVFDNLTPVLQCILIVYIPLISYLQLPLDPLLCVSSSQLHVVFRKPYISLSPVSAALVCMGVGPFNITQTTCQWSQHQRKMTFFHQLWNANSFSAVDEALGAPPLFMLELILYRTTSTVCPWMCRLCHVKKIACYSCP